MKHGTDCTASCMHPGKYIKLQYGKNWKLGGARTLPFLLEKSRLVHQEQNERNYHVFYQLCKGVSTSPPFLFVLVLVLVAIFVTVLSRFLLFGIVVHNTPAVANSISLVHQRLVAYLCVPLPGFLSTTISIHPPEASLFLYSPQLLLHTVSSSHAEYFARLSLRRRLDPAR